MRLLLFGIELLKFCLDLLPTLLELISGLLDVSLGNAEKSRIIMVGDTLKKAGDSSQNSLVKDVGDTQYGF
ncbi:hypothetical protein RYX36_037147 [Vicia faba]